MSWAACHVPPHLSAWSGLLAERSSTGERMISPSSLFCATWLMASAAVMATSTLSILCSKSATSLRVRGAPVPLPLRRSTACRPCMMATSMAGFGSNVHGHGTYCNNAMHAVKRRARPGVSLRTGLALLAPPPTMLRAAASSRTDAAKGGGGGGDNGLCTVASRRTFTPRRSSLDFRSCSAMSAIPLPA